MYKVNGFRLILLIGSLLSAIMALRIDIGAATPLLWLLSVWLLASALLLQLGYRWPAQLPWQLVPSLLLASLLWLAPEPFAAWLWAFVILMMLPQPHWMMALNALLAGISWWQVSIELDTTQASLSGLLLAALLLVGTAHALQLRPLWHRVSQRQRLIPGVRLWSAARLEQAMARERARSERDPLHVELLLIRIPSHLCWSAARHLTEASRGFEPCYRLDRRTLVVMLVGKSAHVVHDRCSALLASLDQHGTPYRARTLPLSESDRLDEARTTLTQQRERLVHPSPVPGP